MPLKSVFVVGLLADTHTHTHNHILDAVNKVCKVVGGGRWVEKVGGCSDPADLKNKLVALTQQD